MSSRVTSPTTRVIGGAAFALLALLACDRPLTAPPPAALTPAGTHPGGPQALISALTCTGSRDAGVTCTPDAPATGTVNPLIVGGQGVYVELNATNKTYNAGTQLYAFDVTVKNLIPQALGTADGATLDGNGVRIFFSTLPTATAGTGAINIVPDGYTTGTAAGQPYYQYNEVVAEGQTSAIRTWSLYMAPTVTTFTFRVYVMAAVQYPDGYFDVTAPSTLTPAQQYDVATVRRTAVGTVSTATHPLVWTSSDTSVATVDSTGHVIAIAAGTTSITVTDSTRTHSMPLSVTGATRVWNGSVSSDWSNAANWNQVGPAAPARVPSAADSVVVPASAPNMPVMVSAVTIAGLTVASGGSLALGNLDLTVNGSVAVQGTGAVTAAFGTLNLTGTAATVAGTLPSVRLTGSYTQSGDVTAVTFIVDDGLLNDDDYTLDVEGQ